MYISGRDVGMVQNRLDFVLLKTVVNSWSMAMEARYRCHQRSFDHTDGLNRMSYRSPILLLIKKYEISSYHIVLNTLPERRGTSSELAS
jgi:hypothetical protein